jgi:tetratricopeptide (TPR) repeat protein
MLSRKHQSLQDIIKLRQQSEFVGREDQVSIFRRNFPLPPEDAQRRFLFTVYGQGGAGKTWLLRYFRKIAEELGAITTYSDESDPGVLEAMESIAAQFEQQGYPLKTFDERYRIYRQRQNELEADPDAPDGLTAFAGGTLFKVGLRLARRIPVGGALVDFIDEETLSTHAREWTTYLTKKLTNKDEVRLMLEPITLLTPLFLKDIYAAADEQPIAIFFDTYERTSEFLDVWLRDMLEGKYGKMPLNIVLTIAGRDELEKNHWAPYMSLVAQLPLEIFSEEEVYEYLRRKGVTNQRVVDVILRLSGRLPLLVATLAVESPHSPEEVDDPSDTAVERFLKWVDDTTQRQVAIDAALPQQFNRDVLTVLVNKPTADDLFEWLKGMPFISEHSSSWTYHQVVRSSMLRYTRRDSPQHWIDLHGRLAGYYDALRANLGLVEVKQWLDETWQGYTLQTIYHCLCQAPHQYLSLALDGFLTAHKKQQDFARRWANTIYQSGEDAGAKEILKLGEYLIGGLKVPAKEHRKAAAQMFSALLEYSEIERQWLPYIFSRRGNLYMLMKQYDDALADFNKAVELDPKSAWIFAHRGSTYKRMGCYDDALRDLSHSIELDSTYIYAYGQRADTYREMERYDDAFNDYGRALELDPNDAFYIYELGYTRQVMGNNTAALMEYKRAVEVSPDYAPAIAFCGHIHYKMGRYDDALKEFNRAIELESEDPFSLNGRGLTYLSMKHYAEAIKDFNRTIEVKPNYSYAIFQRGVAYQQMGRYEEALKDFNRLIDVKPDNYTALGRIGQIYLLMKYHDKALSMYTHLIEVKPISWNYFSRALVYLALQQGSKASEDLNQAIVLASQAVTESPTLKAEAINLPLYYLLTGAFDEAERIYRQTLISGIQEIYIQAGIQDLEYILTLYPDHHHARRMLDLLKGALNERNR